MPYLKSHGECEWGQNQVDRRLWVPLLPASPSSRREEALQHQLPRVRKTHFFPLSSQSKQPGWLNRQRGALASTGPARGGYGTGIHSGQPPVPQEQLRLVPVPPVSGPAALGLSSGGFWGKEKPGGVGSWGQPG